MAGIQAAFQLCKRPFKVSAPCCMQPAGSVFLAEASPTVAGCMHCENGSNVLLALSSGPLLLTDQGLLGIICP